MVHFWIVDNNAGESLRGHSSIEAALDLALLIEREERADTVKVKSTKTRGVDVAPFGAIFTYDHRPGTDELARVRFYGFKIEDLVSDAAAKAKILDLVGETPDLNKGELTNAVKKDLPDVGINRIWDNIDYLASQGELIITAGARNAKLYSLPSKGVQP